MENIIYSYTWDDAINDGTFIRIPEELSKQFFKYPIAITSTIWNQYLDDNASGKMHDILWMMKNGEMDGNICRFKVKIGKKLVAMEAVCEARGPDNPEAIMTIYLPEER